MLAQESRLMIIKRALVILFYGSYQKTMNRHGILHGGEDDLVGTLSVQL